MNTTAAQSLAVEFQVRFTGLDTLGDERAVTSPTFDLHEAIRERDAMRTRQEDYRLTVDACIWVQVGGGPWREWRGEASRSCEMAGCDRGGAEMLSACGIYYLCPACRARVEELSAVYANDDAGEADRLAEKAEARS